MTDLLAALCGRQFVTYKSRWQLDKELITVMCVWNRETEILLNFIYFKKISVETSDDSAG
jgi:hypothetical protein